MDDATRAALDRARALLAEAPEVAHDHGGPEMCPRCGGLPAEPAPPTSWHPEESHRGEPMRESWVSRGTYRKEEHYSGIVDMHATICKGILPRCSSRPYLYIECHAGPGRLAFEGREFEGSPLIAQRALVKAGFDYEAIHFEKDADVAGRLAEALYVPTSLLETPDPERSPIFVEPCEEGLPRWLASIGTQPDRYGLIYADPIGKAIPVEMLAHAARLLPRVDQVVYASATAYKKRRRSAAQRGDLGLPLLSDDVAKVQRAGKRYALIREKTDVWQWTFILLTNWDGFPEWERIGLYRLDSPRGQQILEELDFTPKELHEARNTPLPFDDEPPYRSYREYLRHPKFLAVRKIVFDRAGGRCERCGLRPPSEPHHLRYPPWGTFDVPENLIAICHQCHCEIHGKAS